MQEFFLNYMWSTTILSSVATIYSIQGTYICIHVFIFFFLIQTMYLTEELLLYRLPSRSVEVIHCKANENNNTKGTVYFRFIPLSTPY